jgi:CheY-like chemotaxis protein
MPPTLLIVEDNDDDLFLLTRALKGARVTNPIRSVRSGAELTKYLMGIGEYRDRALHPLPELIFLDLKLRDMQGTDVLRFLNGQKDLNQISVLVWSGWMGPVDKLEMADLQIKCRVLKPYSQELLNETVRSLNDYLGTEGLPPSLHFA